MNPLLYVLSYCSVFWHATMVDRRERVSDNMIKPLSHNYLTTQEMVTVQCFSTNLCHLNNNRSIDECKIHKNVRLSALAMMQLIKLYSQINSLQFYASLISLRKLSIKQNYHDLSKDHPSDAAAAITTTSCRNGKEKITTFIL